MDDVQRLLEQFIAEERGGGAADPAAYLSQVGGAERAALEALLDAHLARAPRRPFDVAAFAASPARPVAERLTRTLAGRSGSWPSLLPELRARARLKRSEVVERLASALGVSGEAAQVGSYYHAMEQGSLPAERVSDRVLEALAGIVGSTREALRSAGAAAVSASSPELPEAAFARLAHLNPDFAEGDVMGVDAGAAASERGIDPERQLVDELFTGGQG